MPVVHGQDRAVMIIRLPNHGDGLVHVAWQTSKSWDRWTTACAYGTGFRPELASLGSRDIQVVVVSPPTCLFCIARPRLFKELCQ